MFEFLDDIEEYAKRHNIPKSSTLTANSLESYEENEDLEMSEEDYYDQLGMERFIGLSDYERREALDIVKRDSVKYKANIKKIIEKLDKYLDKEIAADKYEKYKFKKLYDSKSELIDDIDKTVDIVCSKLKTNRSTFGNGKGKCTISLFKMNGINKSKAVLSYLGMLFLSVLCAWIVIFDKNQNKVQETYKENKEDAKSGFGTKLICRERWGSGDNLEYTFSLQIKLNLKKIWKAGGMEDFAESAMIEEEMNKFLNA